MKMHRVTGTIEGIAPLLFSRFYKDVEGTGGTPTQAQRDQEAFLRLHRDEERGCYIPRESFKQSVLGGAKAGKVQNGRANYATRLEAVMFPEDHLWLGKKTYDEEFPHWGKVPPRTGAAVMLRYPLFKPGWQASFSLMMTGGEEKDLEAAQRSIAAGGLLVGVGSWRPEYGRYVLKDFAVEELTA